MISELADYVIYHTERGECNCGQCCDRGDKPDPTGHTCDVGFFKVAARNNPNAEDLKRLVAESHKGYYSETDPFDGNPHNYIELGGWIGDQGLAMQFMALSHLLGLAHVFTTPGGPVLLPNWLGRVMEERNKE